MEVLSAVNLLLRKSSKSKPFVAHIDKVQKCYEQVGRNNVDEPRVTQVAVLADADVLQMTVKKRFVDRDVLNRRVVSSKRLNGFTVVCISAYIVISFVCVVAVDPRGEEFRCEQCKSCYFSKWSLRRHVFQRHDLYVPNDGEAWRPPTEAERREMMSKGSERPSVRSQR